jgi:signal transduction histidine kinase
MNFQQKEPVLLEMRISPGRPWGALVIGAVAGAGFEILICEPLNILFYQAVQYLQHGAPFRLAQVLDFFTYQWSGVTLTGCIYGAALGFVFYKLKESRQRLKTLHQDFELQVATLRHHYKNLAIGIKGFSSRVKKKLTAIKEQLGQSTVIFERFHPECEALERDVTILDDAAQRLSHTLGEELLFLRALASDSLTAVPGDFYPHLIHAANDLMGLRFQEKDIRVEINGRPLEECRDSLSFHFEPYSMEVILQNILSNAMKFGDQIQIRVSDVGRWVQVEVQDNGPGLEVEKLKNQLLTPMDRRGGESTHLGLKVSLHLLTKIGGRLSVSSPGTGAIFTLEFPK